MPDTPAFARQRMRTPEWIRARQQLHWMIVEEAGRGRVEDPPYLDVG
jgi:hypothetical protein